MSPASRSMTVWTAYVSILGAALLVIPNVILCVFQIDETDEPWIRIVGILLISLGAYYWTAVRDEYTPMYLASVWVRWGIVVGLVVLAFATGPWQLVLFASVDLLGGMWTYATLRRSSTETAP